MSDETPKVSAIITNYNNAAYLRQCLLSVCNQTLQNLEIIVVDDGSVDNSREIIEEVAHSDNRIRPILQENGGFGAAANAGIKAATGEYIAFVDSDDYLLPDMYQVLYDAAVSGKLDIVRGDHFDISGEGEDLTIALFSVTEPSVYGKVLCPTEWVPQSQVGGVDIFRAFGYIWDSLYRRDFLLENNIWVNDDVPTHNDIGFYFQTMALAKRFQYVKAANYHHRTDNANQSMRDEEKLFRNFLLEHKFIEETFKARGLWNEYRDLILRREYSNYLTVLDRLADDRRDAYVRLAGAALAEHEAEVSFRTFLGWQWPMANLLMRDPRVFLQRWREQHYQISVIIPVFNGEDFLCETLDSVLNQSLAAIEVVIVDDGSTDRTPEIIAEYVAKDPRLIATRQENAGAGAARNLGTTLAHSRYLYYLDADDVIQKDCLRKAIRAANAANADLLLFGAKSENMTTKKTESLRSALKQELLPKKNVFALKDFTANPLYAVIGWTWDKLFRREFVLRENLKFDPLNVSNDATFTYLALCVAPRISVLPEELVTHRTNIPGSVSSRHELFPLDSWRFLESLHDRLDERGLLDKAEFRCWFQNYCLHRVQWVAERLVEDDAVRAWFDYAPSALEHLELLSMRESEVEPARRSDFELTSRVWSMHGSGVESFQESLLINPISSTPTFGITQVKLDDNSGREGRVIFLEMPKDTSPSGWGLPLLHIDAMAGPWASTYAVIDVTLLTNHGRVSFGRVKLATTTTPAEGTPGIGGAVVVDDFSLSADSDSEIAKNILLVIRGRSLEIWGRFVDRYAGLSWSLITLESRDSMKPRWSPAPDTGLTRMLKPVPSDFIAPTVDISQVSKSLAGYFESLTSLLEK